MGGSIRATLTGLALAVLAGCQTGPRHVDNDPLYGGGPTATPTSGSSSRRDEPRPRSEAPPIPPPNTTSSPAALTTGAITSTGERHPPVEGVTLGGPRPKVGSAPAREEATSRSPAPVSGDTYEALQVRLQDRGIVWQQLKMVDRERWDFYCAIPDPQQPTIRRMYEARARASASEAMREVLAEIDAERR